VFRLARSRPRLAGWALLSAAICLFLGIEGREVILTVGQWFALFSASVVVAGLCVWIVSGTDDGTPPPEASGPPDSRPPEGSAPKN
jgi:hypothetical protein